MLETFLMLKSNKQFVLLDEPFSGLMPLHIDMVKRLIQSEKSQKGIILSDHLYRHALDLADNVYLLNAGKTYLVQHPGELEFRGYVNER